MTKSKKPDAPVRAKVQVSIWLTGEQHDYLKKEAAKQPYTTSAQAVAGTLLRKAIDAAR